jgi:hypothetical protein
MDVDAAAAASTVSSMMESTAGGEGSTCSRLGPRKRSAAGEVPTLPRTSNGGEEEKSCVSFTAQKPKRSKINDTAHTGSHQVANEAGPQTQLSCMSGLQTAVWMSLNPQVDAAAGPFTSLYRDALVTVYSFIPLTELRPVVRVCSHWRSVSLQEPSRRVHASELDWWPPGSAQRVCLHRIDEMAHGAGLMHHATKLTLRDRDIVPALHHVTAAFPQLRALHIGTERTTHYLVKPRPSPDALYHALPSSFTLPTHLEEIAIRTGHKVTSHPTVEKLMDALMRLQHLHTLELRVFSLPEEISGALLRIRALTDLNLHWPDHDHDDDDPALLADIQQLSHKLTSLQLNHSYNQYCLDASPTLRYAPVILSTMFGIDDEPPDAPNVTLALKKTPMLTELGMRSKIEGPVVNGFHLLPRFHHLATLKLSRDRKSAEPNRVLLTALAGCRSLTDLTLVGPHEDWGIPPRARYTWKEPGLRFTEDEWSTLFQSVPQLIKCTLVRPTMSAESLRVLEHAKNLREISLDLASGRLESGGDSAPACVLLGLSSCPSLERVSVRHTRLSGLDVRPSSRAWLVHLAHACLQLPNLQSCRQQGHCGGDEGQEVTKAEMRSQLEEARMQVDANGQQTERALCRCGAVPAIPEPDAE